MKLFYSEWDLDEMIRNIERDFPSFDKRFSPFFEIKYRHLFEFFQNNKSENTITLKYNRNSVSLKNGRKVLIYILDGFEPQVIDMLEKANS
ncbi:hypothetical protein [Aliarcobacter butzleri]|uniref:hypothetical protein n=1 Tax=Aliarcobacter butzleri TaxID=28197 RepID=UPI001EDBDDC2|nr:hypothetical protein [Aliarcobacter butzleri]MCG3671978.1 hypothetical protein [Aliarcobacter butzleri]